MKVHFRESFLKEIEPLGNDAIKKRIRETIAKVEQAAALEDIKNLKKLKSIDPYYRIRIGNYRLGLALQKGALVFIRCLPCKDIYRYFKRS